MNWFTARHAPVFLSKPLAASNHKIQIMFGIENTTDNAVALLRELGVAEENISRQLTLLAETDARYLRDLKINVTNALKDENLTKKESFLLAYAVAVNDKAIALKEAFAQSAINEGATDKELAEVVSCTSLLNANNVYYRFRHFMNEEFYNTAPAGMRMSIMANPILGKEFFELVSLMVSALNGCELCVTSHEKTLITQGTSKQRILAAVRMGASIRSLAVLM
jgi:alkyl hydroperoxide reductase subunit D